MRRVVLWTLSCLVACGCDDGGPTEATVDAAADTALVPDPDPPAECDGVDEDGDGVCDRLAADWTREARVEPGADRADIYALGASLDAVVGEGLLHAQRWPVDVSGILMPHQAMERALDPEATDETLLRLRGAAASVVGFETTPEFYAWLGLPPYNPPEVAALGGPYHSPRPAQAPDDAPMGVGLVSTPDATALTFSCAACHAGRLLGRTVMGLGNRQSRANAFFRIAKQLLPTLDSPVVFEVVGITEGERALVERTLEAARRVDAVRPLALGLDTSLAQVALSLARRGDDPYATPDRARERQPVDNALADTPADSKPMPWWTLKYKTRWLADGSIVAGNPVLTNFLWNELGRGTDLVELEAWMQHNPRAIDALTVAVFASTPPRWTDYFAAESIDLDAAKRGQQSFAMRCARCHGTYHKAWDDAMVDGMDATDLLATTRVEYHPQTPVFDVGTDPLRADGMRAFADRLNALAISEWMQTVVEPQAGYVPPPLDGIWGRYPYLHNGSVPTLCALLSPVDERPVMFRAGPSEDAEADFDAECVGYPTGEAVPAAWAEVEDSLIDTTQPGLGNGGHTEMLDGSDGNPPLGADERADLVEFLKTL